MSKGVWVVVAKDGPATGFYADSAVEAHRIAKESDLLESGEGEESIEPLELRSILARLRKYSNEVYQKPDWRGYEYFAEDRLRDIRSNVESAEVADRDLFEIIAIYAICGILHCERGEVR